MRNLLKIRDACEALSVNEKTLRDMIARRVIKGVKLGPKTTRVTQESIDALIFGPSKFDIARRAIDAELYAAIQEEDYDRMSDANAANIELAQSRYDLYRGDTDLARSAADAALAHFPDMPEILEYRRSL